MTPGQQRFVVLLMILISGLLVGESCTIFDLRSKLAQAELEREILRAAATHAVNKQEIEFPNGETVIYGGVLKNLSPKEDGLAYDERTKSYVVAPIYLCSDEHRPRCVINDEGWYMDTTLPRVYVLGDYDFMVVQTPREVEERIKEYNAGHNGEGRSLK